MHSLRSLALALLAGALAFPALAQPSGDAVAEAREHFERGIEFFNEGRNDAALAEFERAYQIAPTPPVLYNIARVHEALGDSVSATDAYTKYLEDAGDSLNRRRRSEVIASLERQRARIAFVTVTSNVEGASISVDGVDVATTPLDGPLRLSAGQHTIGVRAAGYDSVRRAVQLAGGDRVALELPLDAILSAQGTIRIEANVPDVAIAIDGQSLGTTPLDATVPIAAGTHTVTAHRPGYRPRQETFDLAGGAERVIRFDMVIDEGAPGDVFGQIHLRLPRGPSVVRIDGEPARHRDGSITLPTGPHRLQLEVAEREPYEADVLVPANDAIELTPALLWTPDARAQRVSAANRTRDWGLVLALSGAALLVGGLGVLGWNEGRISRTDDALVELNDEYAMLGCDTGGPPERCRMLEEQGNALTADQRAEQRARWVSGAVLGVGTILGTIGLVLWVRAPSEAEIDADAQASGRRLRLRAGLGELSLEGRF